MSNWFVDIEKTINRLENLRKICKAKSDMSVGEGKFLWACYENAVEDAISLLKEQELPTELKQKMWNALYAEEDEYEKKFVGKEEHLNWFTVYRPWLQKGFDIAINAIADWEGR